MLVLVMQCQRNDQNLVTLGNVMAEVVIAVDSIEFGFARLRGARPSRSTSRSGTRVTAIVKSTEVLIGRELVTDGGGDERLLRGRAEVWLCNFTGSESTVRAGRRG